MEIAINYSPQAAELLKRGAIAPDRFKLPDFPEMLAEARQVGPVYVHFPFGAGTPRAREIDVAATERWLADTQTPCVNVHLNARDRDWPDLAARWREPAAQDELAAAALDDLRWFAGRFGPGRVIAENVPTWGAASDYNALFVEPGRIAEVIRAAEVGLLLDLSHARLTAEYLGVDARDYIEALPVERLRELHVTGVGEDGPGRFDHQPMHDDDWPFVTWALERIGAGAWGRPWVVSLEYGGTGPFFGPRSDPAVIARDLPRLTDLVRGAARRRLVDLAGGAE